VNKVDFLSFDLSVMNGSSSVRCKAKRVRSQGDGVREHGCSLCQFARPCFNLPFFFLCVCESTGSVFVLPRYGFRFVAQKDWRVPRKAAREMPRMAGLGRRLMLLAREEGSAYTSRGDQRPLARIVGVPADSAGACNSRSVSLREAGSLGSQPMIMLRKGVKVAAPRGEAKMSASMSVLLTETAVMSLISARWRSAT